MREMDLKRSSNSTMELKLFLSYISKLLLCIYQISDYFLNLNSKIAQK